MAGKKKTQLTKADIKKVKPLLIKTTEGRRLLSQHSYKFYAKYYLDIDLRPCQIRWLNHITDKPNAGVLAPVGHGKTIALQVFALKNICENRNIRILFLSAELKHAKKNLGVISRALKSNKRLIADYGRFYDQDNDWTKTYLSVIRSSNLTDYTVEAIGLEGGITGGHYDIIILDDIVTIENARSETLRQKTSDFYNSTIENRLDKGGSIIFIGTRKDYADQYGQFLKQSVIWDILVEKAIIEEPERYEFVELDKPYRDEDGKLQRHKVVISGRPGKALDPINKPMEYLLLKRYSFGSRLFQAEFQNEIISDVTALFKLEWLEKCKDETLSYIDYDIRIDERGKLVETGSGAPPPTKFVSGKDYKLTVSTGGQSSRYSHLLEATDPAVVTDKKSAEKHDTSFMVSFLVGLLLNGNFDILHIFRDRGLSPSQKLNIATALNKRLKPYRHFWESNAAGNMDIADIEEKSRVPVMPHYTGKNKNDAYAGVSALSVMFERQRVRLPYRTDRDKQITDQLISEFHKFPDGEHDDMVMALWIAFSGSGRVLDEYEYLKKKGRIAA